MERHLPRRFTLAKLLHAADTPQECPPRLQLRALNFRILFVQRDIGSDVDSGIAGRAVVVSRWELQRVNIQIIEHGGNWDLTVKFFKHQHGLSVVGIEFRAILATVIGNAADVLRLVGCKNASRLSGSAVTIEIKHLNGSIFLDIPLCLAGYPASRQCP